MRRLLTMLLEIDGRQVISYSEKGFASDSILALVRSERPSVILIDVHLRDVSGIDVLRAIRTDPSLRDVRVIMSSGSDVKDECMRAGASDFLMKPFMPDDLLSRLDN